MLEKLDFKKEIEIDNGCIFKVELKNASLAEYLICLKLIDHVLQTLVELAELRRKQENKNIVENEIKKLMGKLMADK